MTDPWLLLSTVVELVVVLVTVFVVGVVAPAVEVVGVAGAAAVVPVTDAVRVVSDAVETVLLAELLELPWALTAVVPVAPGVAPTDLVSVIASVALAAAVPSPSLSSMNPQAEIDATIAATTRRLRIDSVESVTWVLVRLVALSERRISKVACIECPGNLVIHCFLAGARIVVRSAVRVT